MTENSELKNKIFEAVKLIPKGKIAYFGQIATFIGSDARTVGWILSGMGVDEYELIPWYRVVSKNGFISSLKLGEKGLLQKQILLKEGYQVIDDCVDMNMHGFSFTDSSEAEILF
jgi:methylated-DNA-protein-cysteine methyltransferase-like protein